MVTHLAVDIGASSGRIVAGTLRDEKLDLDEIHRFSNGMEERNGHYYWDIDHLYEEVLQGLKKAKKLGIDRCTLGIDTWAVDYALLDEQGNRIQEIFAYRDSRTQGVKEEFHSRVSEQTLYQKTGIQTLSFNTIYQLTAHDQAELSRTHQMLLVPDYLYYMLTGYKMNEVTNASTTQLLNVTTRDYDADLLSCIGMSREQFPALTEPGTRIDGIRPELRESYDLPDCEVICVATHDTASAVLGVPAEESSSWAYISSGTWSLIGVEQKHVCNDDQAMELNFTNEWGAYGTYRFLKNIMGLWLIQEVCRLDGQHSFAELVDMAVGAEPFRSIISCNDERFLHPDNMIEEIREACRETGQPVPDTLSEIARCVFDSLAVSYRMYLKQLEKLTGEKMDVLHIVGGGANNELLCQLTADVTGIVVIAGPTESTAIGNMIVQMISTGIVEDLDQARSIVRGSFPIKIYKPSNQSNILGEEFYQ